MKIAIYQINSDRDENNVAFLNYENLERLEALRQRCCRRRSSRRWRIAVSLSLSPCGR